ncbi:MAG: prepilin-type N-terminal cleavage/methylation domain-containing protein [bacterium]|nr:prepilin-type N-terminal cleavage/methylation domain-containing protein [bacterium]
MKSNKNKKNKNYQGFSLLEMLISMFIFVVTIIIAVSIFANVASARQKSRKIQKNMEDARTALDLMAKNMRMSTGLGEVSNQEIYMYNNSQGQCVSYKFDNNKLKISQETPSDTDNPACDTITYPSYSSVIGSDVSGSFVVVPTSIIAPKAVGKATVILTIDGVNMQTSVSFRDYNNMIQ